MKRVIPIVASSVKYLGLTVPEWAITLFPIVIIVAFFPGVVKIYLPFHIIAIIAYIRIFTQMEENILAVVGTWFKIPAVCYGYFTKPIAHRKMHSSRTMLK